MLFIFFVIDFINLFYQCPTFDKQHTKLDDHKTFKSLKITLIGIIKTLKCYSYDLYNKTKILKQIQS